MAVTLISQPSTHHHRSTTLPINDLTVGRTNSRASVNGFVHVDIPQDEPSNAARNRPGLLRSQSAYNPRELLPNTGGEEDAHVTGAKAGVEGDAEWQTRHGWDLSAEQLRELSSVSFP